MSQYHAQRDSAADDAGFEPFVPELAPFLPTMDQSGRWNMPVHAGTGTPVGSKAALPSNVETLSLHAKAGFIGASLYGASRNESQPAHTCAACSTFFPNNHQLEQHATKNKHKAYLCTCGKAFSKNSALKRHVGESTQAREYKCPKCDTGFKRPGHVEQHLRLVHQMSKDAIKDLLSVQKLQPHQEFEQESTDSAAVPSPGSLDAKAGYPIVNPGGPWTGPINFSARAHADHPGSRLGFYPALSSGSPAPMTGLGTTAISAQDFMTQAPGFPAYPAYVAGAVADQTGLSALPAPDFAAYPAVYPNLDLDLFNVDPALASLNPADGFEMPTLETEFMGELFDFDSNTFGF